MASALQEAGVAEDRLRQLFTAVELLGDEALLDDSTEACQASNVGKGKSLKRRRTPRSSSVLGARNGRLCMRRSASGESSETRQHDGKQASSHDANKAEPDSEGACVDRSVRSKHTAEASLASSLPPPHEASRPVSPDQLNVSHSDDITVSHCDVPPPAEGAAAAPDASRNGDARIGTDAPAAAPAPAGPDAALARPRLSSTNAGGSHALLPLTAVLKAHIRALLSDYSAVATADLELRTRLALSVKSDVKPEELQETLGPAMAAVQEARHFTAHLTTRTDAERWPLADVLRPDLLPASVCTEVEAYVLAARALALTNGDPALALACLLRIVEAPPPPPRAPPQCPQDSKD